MAKPSKKDLLDLLDAKLKELVADERRDRKSDPMSSETRVYIARVGELAEQLQAAVLAAMEAVLSDESGKWADFSSDRVRLRNHELVAFRSCDGEQIARFVTDNETGTSPDNRLFSMKKEDRKKAAREFLEARKPLTSLQEQVKLTGVPENAAELFRNACSDATALHYKVVANYWPDNGSAEE